MQRCHTLSEEEERMHVSGYLSDAVSVCSYHLNVVIPVNCKC